jgi:galactose mutarotase-like enzyme
MIDVSWTGFPDLGLWSKPMGASFLCIEPWHGTASPVGLDGPFRDKPGLIHLSVGETRQLSFAIEAGSDERGDG